MKVAFTEQTNTLVQFAHFIMSPDSTARDDYRPAEPLSGGKAIYGRHRQSTPMYRKSNSRVNKCEEYYEVDDCR